MQPSDRVRLLALPAPVAANASRGALADVRTRVDPAGVWIPGPDRRPRAAARARFAFDAPVVHPPLGDGPSVRVDEFGDADGSECTDGGDYLVVATVRSGALLPDVAPIFDDRGTDRRALVVCDDVTTTLNPTALEARLECAAELAALGREIGARGEVAPDADDAGPALTVLTGGLPADYDRIWRLTEDGSPIAVGTRADPPRGGSSDPADPAGSADPDGIGVRDGIAVRIRGIGPVESYGGARSVAWIDVDPDGRLDVETADASAFGLEAVEGIGPKTADRLESRGVETREDLLETPVAELAELPGVGRRTAERMHHHARVLETGEPLLCTDESPPGADWGRPPLCLDIETDGLSPSIIWQVGVYDPATDEHRAFVERTDPADPAPVIEAFCDWLFGVHPDRALLTWNGWRFDYRHLTAFVERHAPYYAEEWSSVPKLDLYLWAATDGNALLPGRTNKLEDVAAALGYEFAGTGLDGAATAAAYERFRRTGVEPDWERHERYCEDDCRALWHVFERLREAERAGDGRAAETRSAGRGTGDGAQGDRTEQVGLGDF